MKYYRYKSIDELLIYITNVNFIKILDVTKNDCIETRISNYTIDKTTENYYDLLADISDIDIWPFLKFLNNSEIEEIELLQNSQKKYYINFVEKIIQVY